MADDRYITGDIVMGTKDLSSISNFGDLHISPVRKLHITVEVIDKNNRTIETIQGLSTAGSVNVSNSSLIRRTGSLSFVLYDKLLPKKDSVLWMTNKIRVYAGLENIVSNGSITHFCLGTFHITEPKVNISSDSREITIELEDSMMKWEQEEIELKMEIEEGTPLHTAVESLMHKYGEFNTKIDFTTLTVPHLLEFNEGTPVTEIITKLRDLYMDWECYYDIDGTFVFRKMDIQKEEGEPTVWVFDKERDLSLSIESTFTYKNVKNRVVVVGQMNEKTGLTPRAEAVITNEESPFHFNEIGVKTKVFSENYHTVEQCDSKARYELAKASTFQETLNISTIPIYFLDGNHIIEVRNGVDDGLGKYIIDSISFDLTVEGEMSIQCHKLYYNHFEIDSTLDKHRESADIVIDGIQNKGWLHLAEDMIRDYYGLEGDGSDLVIRFEYKAKYGTTAYTTAYLDSNLQSITIDLADFENGLGDSGDNGTGKAEYSDRVLGHEMVHVVMNNAMGVNKTLYLPNWFKEGVSEFIHGADERLKGSIATDGKLDSTKLDNLTTTIINVVNGAWRSETDYYSAGYVIVKYLDHKLQSVGKNMIDLMYSIKQSSQRGDSALREAIVENTLYASYQEFVNDVTQHIANHIRYNITLNFGVDEIDTGSIAGSDHRGSSHLNAEDIFDNSKSVKGLSSRGFNVIIDTF